MPFPRCSALAEKLPWTRRLTGRRVAWVAAIALGFVALSLLPSLSVGQIPPGRVLNVAYFFLLAGWFATAFVAVAFLRQTRGLTMLAPRTIKLGWICLIVGVLLMGNMPRAIYDLAFVLTEYNRQMQARYASLIRQAAQAHPENLIDELTALPKTIRPGNSNDDRISCVHVGQYFGLRTAKMR